MQEPQRQKLRRLSELEDKHTEEQARYWREDLRKREERKKRLEEERLAIVMKQREEQRVGPRSPRSALYGAMVPYYVGITLTTTLPLLWCAQIKREKERQELRKHVGFVSEGASAAEKANAAIAEKKRRDVARQRADLEEQIRQRKAVRVRMVQATMLAPRALTPRARGLPCFCF